MSAAKGLAARWRAQPSASSGRQTVQRPPDPDPPKYRGLPPPWTNPDPLRHGLLPQPGTHGRRPPAPAPCSPSLGSRLPFAPGWVEAPGGWTHPAPTERGTPRSFPPLVYTPHTEGRALEENPASRYDSSIPRLAHPHSSSMGRPSMGSGAQSLPPQPQRLRDRPGLQQGGVAEAGQAGRAEAPRSVHALTVASGNRGAQALAHRNRDTAASRTASAPSSLSTF